MQARLDGAAMRLRREQNERAWLAWHIAALSRVKDMPKLDSLMARDAPKQAQTEDQMLAILNAVCVANGGEPLQETPT